MGKRSTENYYMYYGGDFIEDGGEGKIRYDG